MVELHFNKYNYNIFFPKSAYYHKFIRLPLGHHNRSSPFYRAKIFNNGTEILPDHFLVYLPQSKTNFLQKSTKLIWILRRLTSQIRQTHSIFQSLNFTYATFSNKIFKQPTQRASICSISTMEIPKKCWKSVQNLQ